MAAGFAATLGATAVFAGWLVLGVGGDSAVLHVDDLGTAAAAFAATLLCLRAAGRHAGPLRRFWWLLAAASGAWTSAEIVWGFYDLVLHRDVPAPSWADIGYLAAMPLAVLALLSHPGMRGSANRRFRYLFDGLVIAAALLFLSWTAILGPLWKSTNHATLSGLVALAYPFGDVVIVFFVVLAVRSLRRPDRLSLWCLLAGLVAMALADSTYAYLAETGSYSAGNALDVGWFVGYLGIALGAFCSRPVVVPAPTAERSRPTLTPVVVGFLPMLAALAVVGIGTQLGHPPDAVGFGIAIALVLLVLARQTLLMIDVMGPAGPSHASLGSRLEAALHDALPDERGAR